MQHFWGWKFYFLYSWPGSVENSGSCNLPPRAIRRAFSETDLGAKQSVGDIVSDPWAFLPSGSAQVPLGQMSITLQMRSQELGKFMVNVDKDIE